MRWALLRWCSVLRVRADAARRGLFGGAVLVGGAALIVGPWLLRTWRTLADERAERIRSQMHADLAAHLHDSVLQTLALIQRQADDPRAVTRLARALTRGREAKRRVRQLALGGDSS